MYRYVPVRGVGIPRLTTTTHWQSIHTDFRNLFRLAGRPDPQQFSTMETD